MMENYSTIKGFLPSSFIDWQGCVCAVLFVGGCNFRCPYCHNHPLVLQHGSMGSFCFDDVLNRLAARRHWLGGICISGGEPTLAPGLSVFLRRLKHDGWAIKLDTNGTRPEILTSLLAEKLVDSISMDVKAPLIQDKYEQCAGAPVDLKVIQSSIELIGASGIDHEFRMTVLPRLHTRKDIEEWAELFSGKSRLTLQNFNPATTLDPDFMDENGFDPGEFTALRGKILENRQQVAA
ncbi:anaerobic ribonucleoside-triphosphate reductase activating protein [Thermodesulfobacteriota bacterium]